MIDCEDTPIDLDKARAEWLVGLRGRTYAARSNDRVNVLIAVRELERLLALAEECLERRRKEAARGDAE